MIYLLLFEFFTNSSSLGDVAVLPKCKTIFGVKILENSLVHKIASKFEIRFVILLALKANPLEASAKIGKANFVENI